MLCFSILSLSSVFAEDATKELEGKWSASRAVRDGKTVTDVVGHRLIFSGKKFQIHSREEAKLLYEGTLTLDPKAEPAEITFHHTLGDLKGKTWKGIYALDGDVLKICDNAPNQEKPRPAEFEAKRDSGYVLITFDRLKP